MPRAAATALALALCALAVACGGEAEDTAAQAEGEPRAELERLLNEARDRVYAPLEAGEQEAGALEGAGDDVRDVADELAAAEVSDDLAEARDGAVDALNEVADRLEGAARSAAEDPTGVLRTPDLDRLLRRPVRAVEEVLDEFREAGYEIEGA